MQIISVQQLKISLKSKDSKQLKIKEVHKITAFLNLVPNLLSSQISNMTSNYFKLTGKKESTVFFS